MGPMDPICHPGDGAERRPALVVVSGSSRLVEHLRATFDADVFIGEGPRASALVILGGATATDLEEVQRSFPGAAVLAILPVEAGEAEMLSLYRAGADLVTGPGTAELLVAHARAMLRRRAWADRGATGTGSFPPVDPAQTDG
jgi:hypothetical protein